MPDKIRRQLAKVTVRTLLNIATLWLIIASNLCYAQSKPVECEEYRSGAHKIIVIGEAATEKIEAAVVSFVNHHPESADLVSQLSVGLSCSRFDALSFPAELDQLTFVQLLIYIKSHLDRVLHSSTWIVGFSELDLGFEAKFPKDMAIVVDPSEEFASMCSIGWDQCFAFDSVDGRITRRDTGPDISVELADYLRAIGFIGALVP